MLVNNSVMKKIDESIDKAYLAFGFMLLGDEFLTEDQKKQVESLGLIIGRKPLVELIYTLVRNRPTEGYRNDKTLSDLLDMLALQGVLPAFNDVQLYSIEHAKAAMNEALEAAKKDLKKRVKKEILDANKDYHHAVNARRYGSLDTQAKDKQDHMSALMTALALAVPAAQAIFSKDFTTAMTDLVNDAAVDQMSTEAMMNGHDAKDTLVYKKTMNDSKTCSWCDKLYNNEDGTPRIFKLSELQENGINDSTLKSSWRPTVGATHPRCRCQLRYHKN